MSLEVDISCAYGDFALHVRHEFCAGVTGVFGPSGSGKTLLLRVIAGLEKRATGRVSWEDEEWMGDGLRDRRSRPRDEEEGSCDGLRDRRSRPRDDEEGSGGGAFVKVEQRGVGYVPQEPTLFSHLDVRGNLDFAAKRAGRRVRVEEMAKLLGCEHLLGRDVAALSGGEKQRVSIARALCARPRLLLMDEPLAALDRLGQRELLGVLERVIGELNVPLIYVSHSPEEVGRLTDELMILERGRVVRAGSTQELLADFSGDVMPAFAGSRDAAVYLSANVGGYEANDGLQELKLSAGESIFLPAECAVEGEVVRLLVRAGDVSLAREQARQSSILNILPVRVEQIQLMGKSAAAVRVVLSGGEVIVCHISRRSMKVLDLKVGDDIYVQIKSLALS